MRALLTVLAVLAAAAPTSASLLIYEPFNYPSGANLNGQVNASTGGQWLKSGSNPSGDNQSISSTPLSYPGLQPGAGLSLFTPRLSAANNTANRLTMPSAPYTRAAGGSLFYSFTYRLLEWDAISDSGAKNATHRKGGLIAGFHGGVANTATGMGNAAAFAGTVWVRRAIDYSQTGTDGTPGTQNSQYELGILKTALSPTPEEMELAFDTSQTFDIGDTLFVVVEYQFVDDGTANGDIARMWINPTPGVLSSPSIVAPVNTAGITGSINSFFIFSHTNSPGDSLVDEVRVGTTFASVTPVPEPTSAVLAGIAAVGLVRRRRRRSFAS